VLRPGQPLHELFFAGDDDPLAGHYGAFVGDDLTGIASVCPEAAPAGALPFAVAQPWRLRGMATLPHARGLGLGRALVDACLHHVARHGGDVLWCNARTPAAGFYLKMGFAVSGEEFEIPGIGPHFVMWRRPAL
jgi:GNAT superfamily N-acetyltransferase